MYKHEGILSYWKGILPPVMVETPKRALKFVCFEQYKPLFMFGSPTPTPLVSTDDTRTLSKNPFRLSRLQVWVPA